MIIPDSLLKLKHNRTISAEIALAEAEIKQLQGKISEERGKLKYKCSKCSNLSKLRDTHGIRHHHYVEPQGCTLGDYWDASGVSYICPKCNTKLKPAYSEREQWELLSYYFKSLSNEHN